MENFEQSRRDVLSEKDKKRIQKLGDDQIKFEETLMSLLTNLELPNHVDNWLVREQFLKEFKKNKDKISDVRNEIEKLAEDSKEYELKEEELIDLSYKNSLIAKYLLESMENIEDKASILFRDKMHELGVSGELLRRSLENASAQNELATEYRRKWLLGESNAEYAERKKRELEKNNQKEEDEKDEDYLEEEF